MKATTASIVFAIVLIGGAFLLSRDGGDTQQIVNENNVSIVDGVQIIEIAARGGYSPRRSIAQPGIPTIIRFKTKGTFDCSSSIRIPEMNISRILPQTGSTDIDIGSPATSTLQGTCGMGMYFFEVAFQS